MRANYWIEFSGKRKLAVFCLAVAAVFALLAVLPPEAWLRRSGRRGIPLPALVVVTWIGGLFVAFFVKAEDLHIMAPFDYQTLIRWLGIASAIVGAAFGSILWLRYLS